LDERDIRVIKDVREYLEDGFNLREWILAQRKAYNAEKIAKTRIELLENLMGWSWNTRIEKYPSR
jgi:hypothetical protein